MIKKRYMGTTVKLLGATCLLLHSSFFVSCTDWDDHYDANTALLESQNNTVWENITANPNLSQFASLLRQTGYDEVLGASQTFTVWAPLNDSFDFQTLSQQNDSTLLKEFVQNHIARNNYQATGDVNVRVPMLNEKKMTFGGAGSYSIQGIPVEQANLGSSNGVVHLLNGKIPFLQNIYESLNADTYPIDSISNYFHSKDVRRFNESKSVVGPMKNGEMTYLDSIFDEHNDLYARYRAYINREDSNYTMLLPTNEAWNKAKERIESYFNYLPTFKYFDRDNDNDALGSHYSTASINAAYLKDSVTTIMLMRDLFYNNNLYSNKQLNSLQTGETLACDSLYSTTGAKVYSDDAANLFVDAVRLDKSNGALWLTDSLRMQSWTSWNPEIVLEAESNSMLATTSYVSTTNNYSVTAGTRNPIVPGRVSGSRFMEVVPSSSNVNPQVAFYLPQVRSTEYSVYVVFVPPHLLNQYNTPLPYYITAEMYYAGADGNVNKVTMKNPLDNTNYFSNDPNKVDTVYLGDITFPVAYMATVSSSQNYYYPVLNLRSYVRSAQTSIYDRRLRVDCIILRPKELDTYMKEHPDYKYDDGNY